ncbi:hypothetical protein nbrc107697_14770 [Gordonia crocea]|uniref:Uncharacterized protein n=1 Tax=Gordonia crocea TaxID=589162 RepID=A0A7I9UW88_9ACTN|nr:hypothetical protein nbrc107697_14770 [Gordonia crocea]
MEIDGVHRVVRVGQVGEVVDDLGRGQSALEDLRARREGQRVQPGQGGLGESDRLDVQQCLLDQQVEVGRFGPGTPFGGAEHPLADRQLVGDRGRRQGRVVDRHVAHREDGEAALGHRRLDEIGRRGGPLGRFRQEEVADAELTGAQVAAGDLGEEGRRQVDGDPAAVADALRGDPPAVGHRAQRLPCHGDHLVACLPVLAGDEPHPATALVIGAVPQQFL